MFALPMLFLSVIFHAMWSGKILCIIPYIILCLSAIRMMFVKINWQCVAGYCGLNESGLSVNYVQSAFL